MHIKANPYSCCQKHTFLLINSLLKWQNSQAHSGISLERAGFSVKPFISLSQPNIVQHHIHCLTRAENIKYRSHTSFVIILLITILSERTSVLYRREKKKPHTSPHLPYRTDSSEFCWRTLQNTAQNKFYSTQKGPRDLMSMPQLINQLSRTINT